MDTEFLSISEVYKMHEEDRCSAKVLCKLTTDDLKQLLSEYVLTDSFKEAIISELSKRIPGYEFIEEDYIHAADLSIIDDKKYPVSAGKIFRYPALQWISAVIRFFSISLFIAGFVFLFSLVFSDDEITNIDLLIFGAILTEGIVTLAISELIRVFADISTNLSRVLNRLNSKL